MLVDPSLEWRTRQFEKSVKLETEGGGWVEKKTAVEWPDNRWTSIEKPKSIRAWKHDSISLIWYFSTLDNFATERWWNRPMETKIPSVGTRILWNSRIRVLATVALTEDLIVTDWNWEIEQSYQIEGRNHW